MGPKAARGLERGLLTVQCQYGPGYKNYVKWWCRGADWGRCKFVVKTTGSEQEVKKDRVSIKDNQKNCSFTVTMEKLRLNDADTYWCGIERIGTDLGVQIEVTVDPGSEPRAGLGVGEQAEQWVIWSVRQAPAAVPTTTSTTTTFTAPVTTGDTRGHPSNGGSSVFMNLSVLIPLVFAVLLFLLVVASLVAWRMMKRQKKGEGTWLSLGWGWAGWKCVGKCVGLMASMIIREPSDLSTPVLQTLESDICYANLSLQQTGNSSVSSRKKASRSSSSSAQANQVEVEYVTMAPSPREHIAYAALSLDTLDQEPTYSNTGYLSTHVPSRSHEEPTEYSTIRKP
ncbi:CMRF35-like molecule 1 [Camelus dromedarius]|uniref:CMRF35-like molecule 1 n=1 Tax=Camelus dromedarius TaxID=9838 RepID=A0A5N4D308_CAMDR|nr:CMRF35-like molecule 1 [Camelus dromedarius]